MSRLTPLLLVIALVVGIAGWQSTKPPDGPQTTIKVVDGTLSLSNSLDGAAVLQVGDLAPGETAGGVVALANTGTLSGKLDLSQTNLTDTVGPSGGQLSQALQLTVREIVSGDLVYTGPVSGLERRDLGSMTPGETRTYSFTVLLPDTGTPVSAVSGDNAFAGSSVDVRYLWALNDDPGGGNGGGGGGNGGGGGGGSGGGGTGGGGVISKMRVSVKVSAKTALKKGRLDVTVRCGEPCKVRAYAQLRKRKKMKTRRRSARVRVANKPVKIKIKLPKKVKANLSKTLAKKGKDYIVVYVRATDPRGGVVNLKKQVRVKRKRR